MLYLGPCGQSPKNPGGAVALPTGKFLRVRKVFARIYKITHKCSLNINWTEEKQVWKVFRLSGKFQDCLESF